VRRLALLTFAAALGMLAACTERLTTPADCPDQCPGNSLIVRDTVIEAIFDLDSTYTGYLRATDIPALLVSNGLAAGDARAWATFPRRADSVFLDGLQHKLTVDSAAIAFNVIGRDSAVHGTELVVHRIPPVIDTNTTFAELAAQLTPASVLGTIAINDTGTARLVFAGENLHLIDVFEADSFRLGIGLSLTAPSPTGIRLASLNFSSRPPTMTLYGKIEIADTGRQRQTLSATADSANYVINAPAAPGQQLLFLGGKPGSRAILRFTPPPALKDSAIILRATLELTPAGPLSGLRNDPATLEIRGVLADVGAKSPYLAGLGRSVTIPVDDTGVQIVDLRDIVGTWFVAGAPPSALVIGINPEGGSFARPAYFSSRSLTGRPRIRITYALPSRPGTP
jgi:hypothetical protein